MSRAASDALTAIARAWLLPLTVREWPLMSTAPELADALPRPGQKQIADLAAEWHRLLVRNVPPHEGIFLGSSVTAADQGSSTSAGASGAGLETTVPEDAARSALAEGHIAHGLLALALLEAAEVREPSDRSLTQRLAAWVPPLAWSLRRITLEPFYLVLFELTLDEVLSRLDETRDSDCAACMRAPDIRSADADPIEHPRRELLDAARSGCYISRLELERIARWLQISGLSGSRLELLDGLLGAAAARGDLRKLLIGLEDLIDDARLDYDGMTIAYPAWEPCCRIWSRRLDHGAACIAMLADRWAERSD